MADQPLTPAPTISGSCGDAWVQDLVALHERKRLGRRKDPTLASWLVKAPWANSMWDTYWVLVYHLRCEAGLKVPKMYLPGATHEVMLRACSPDQPLDLLACPPVTLVPSNFAAQFVAASDLEAKARVRAAVQEICEGKLSPDTDYTKSWVARFGDNMIREQHRDNPGKTTVRLEQGGKVQEIVYDGKAADAPVQCIHGKPPTEVCLMCDQMRYDFGNAFRATRHWRTSMLEVPKSLLAQCYITHVRTGKSKPQSN